MPLVLSITRFQLLHMVYVCHVVEVLLYSAPKKAQNPVTEYSTVCSRSRYPAPIPHSAHEHSSAFSADFINRSVKMRFCCFSAVPSPNTVGPVRMAIFQLYTDRLCSKRALNVSRSCFGNFVCNWDRQRIRSAPDLKLTMCSPSSPIWQPLASHSQCSAFQFLIPAQDKRDTSDISFWNKGGNVHVIGISRPLYFSVFYFLDDKSGFEQSNVLSKNRLITSGSILCTPPSYLPMVSTLTIYNDVMVSQYPGFHGSYALPGSRVFYPHCHKTWWTPMRSSFLWRGFHFVIRRPLSSVKLNLDIASPTQTHLESKEPIPIGYRVGNRSSGRLTRPCTQSRPNNLRNHARTPDTALTTAFLRMQEITTSTLQSRTYAKQLAGDSLFNGAGGPTSTLLATCLSHQITNLRRPSFSNMSSIDAKRRSRSQTLTLNFRSPFITHTRPRLWSVCCWPLQRYVERNYEHICLYRFLQFISKSVVGRFTPFFWVTGAFVFFKFCFNVSYWV